MSGSGSVPSDDSVLVPVQELPADPLELEGHRQLPAVQVDVLPAQTQHLAPAQTEVENQHVRAVERIMVSAGGFQELANLGLLVQLDGALALIVGRAVSPRTAKLA